MSTARPPSSSERNLGARLDLRYLLALLAAGALLRALVAFVLLPADAGFAADLDLIARALHSQGAGLLGDGRLMLEAEPPQGFDVLVMDAFSGDSIPTHLITLQAMRGYLRHLGTQGVLAVHISNKYLDLKPVMAAAAQELGLVALLRDIDEQDEDPYCFGSTWVLLMSPERAQALPDAMREARRLQPQPGFRAWTDDFSNLLTILK